RVCKASGLSLCIPCFGRRQWEAEDVAVTARRFCHSDLACTADVAYKAFFHAPEQAASSLLFFFVSIARVLGSEVDRYTDFLGCVHRTHATCVGVDAPLSVCRENLLCGRRLKRYRRGE